MSSELRIARNSPLDRSKPVFRAACAPWLLCSTTRIRPSSIEYRISRLSSVDPSSTTMSSRSLSDCPSTLLTASDKYRAWLNEGMTTETLGISFPQQDPPILLSNTPHAKPSNHSLSHPNGIIDRKSVV